MIPLSPDERRVVVWLGRRAAMYDEAASRNPFSFHATRAKLCRALAAAINDGKHR